jgi:hypothetical protein
MAHDHAVSVHRDIQCQKCHPGAIEVNHESIAPVDCCGCHAPHDEKMIHDAHTRVACNACHQKDGVPALDPESGKVIFSGDILAGRTYLPHQMVAESGDFLCRRCHLRGNGVGASAMILPAKSILCMPCHAATISIGDRITLFSLLIFAAGMSGICIVWFSGSPGRARGQVFRGGAWHLMTTMVAEGVFLRRLYRLSPARWAIHALICYPILLRMAFGMIALCLSLTLPESELAGAMLDKNHPFRGMLFDLTGLMIFTGVAAALFRSREGRPSIADLPEPSRGMTVLLGLVILSGFFLESLRIAMTGWPGGARYAFVGYGASQLLKGMDGITTIYGYVWYVHAILTGAFVALIPFTRMIHIFTAPVVLLADARSRVQPDH